MSPSFFGGGLKEESLIMLGGEITVVVGTDPAWVWDRCGPLCKEKRFSTTSCSGILCIPESLEIKEF